MLSKQHFSVSAVLLVVTLTFSYGQTPKETKPFPTYQQLKPARTALLDYDYVPASRKSATTIVKALNLFDYPIGTVTYILNSQPTNNQQYVKELLRRTDIDIDNVVGEKPDSCGHRAIKITYSLR